MCGIAPQTLDSFQHFSKYIKTLFVESNGNLQGYFPVYPMFNSGLIELLFFEENIKKINLKDSNRNFSSWEIEKDIFINLQITKCNHLENISLKK